MDPRWKKVKQLNNNELIIVCDIQHSLDPDHDQFDDPGIYKYNMHTDQWNVIVKYEELEQIFLTDSSLQIHSTVIDHKLGRIYMICEDDLHIFNMNTKLFEAPQKMGIFVCTPAFGKFIFYNDISIN